MNTSFTPGPWYVGNPERNGCSPDEIHLKEFDQDGESFICETGGNYANARLIAAAPSLYAALHNLVARGLIHTDGDHYDEAIEALNQATGQEP